MRVVDHGWFRLLVALGDALLAFPPPARAAPQLQERGLERVKGGTGRLRVRDAREEVPRLVDEDGETRVAPQRVFYRRVARHLAETQVRGLARVERAGHRLEGVVLAAGRVPHAHHVEVRALSALVLEVPPVERAREAQRGRKREYRLRTNCGRVDPVHRFLHESARMLEIKREVVFSVCHVKPPSR